MFWFDFIIKKFIEEILKHNIVQGEIPNPDGSLTTREDLENAPSEKIIPNKKLIEEVKNDAKGNIIELMHVEQVEAKWQSCIFSRGTRLNT